MRQTLSGQITVTLAGLALIWALAWSQRPGNQEEPSPAFSPTVVVTESADGNCSVRLPTAGGWFVEGVVGRYRVPNPLLATTPIDEQLVGLLFEGLTRLDGNGRVLPALAESWQVSEDGLAVQFRLRQALWHDGQPFSADDVVLTYRLLQEGNIPPWPQVTVTKLDAQTIELRTAQPYSPLLEATTRGVLPAHLLSDVTFATFAAHSFNLRPIGTGPFALSEPLSDRARLIPHPSAWSEQPRIEGLEWRFFASRDEAIQAWQAGQLHSVIGLSADDLPLFATLEDVTLTNTTQHRYTQLLFNLWDEKSVLRNEALRQAVVYATNRAALIQNVLHGQGITFDGPYPPQSWAYNPNTLSLWPHNPLSATLALQEAGASLPEGETVYQWEEKPLILRLLVPDAPAWQGMAQALQTQWGQLGIGSELQVVPVAGWREALSARGYDVALTEIRPIYDPDLYDFYSQRAIMVGQNYGGWNNRKVSEALEEGRQLWPEAERYPYYDLVSAEFSAELPALPLYQFVTSYAVRQGLEGVEIGRVAFPVDRYRTLPRWVLQYQTVPTTCQ